MKHAILFFLLLPAVSSQGQTTISRLVATTDYVYGSPTLNVPQDSLAYFYTGTMGGDPEHTIKYTTDSMWTYGGSAYSPLYAESQTFDTSNNIITTTLQYYVSGSWVDSILLTYTYDANNNVIDWLVQQWNTGTSTWVNYKKTDYTYDAHNNYLTLDHSVWNTTASAWVAAKWYTNTYNTSNQMVSSLGQLWDTATSSFVNYSYDTFAYDGSGNQVSDILQTWTGIGWINMAQDLRTFDATGAVLTDTTFSSLGSSHQWVYSKLAVDSNDASGNQLNSVLSTWAVGSSRFINTTRYVSTYNNYNQLTSNQSFEWGNIGGWYFTGTDNLYLYYYDTLVLPSATPIVNTGEVKLNIYPNPTPDYINIQVKQAAAQPFDITVYDTHGRVVSRQHVQGSTS